jgi:hypothetical protein
VTTVQAPAYEAPVHHPAPVEQQSHHQPTEAPFWSAPTQPSWSTPIQPSFQQPQQSAYGRR